MWSGLGSQLSLARPSDDHSASKVREVPHGTGKQSVDAKGSDGVRLECRATSRLSSRVYVCQSFMLRLAASQDANEMPGGC